jgi:hypothetical protein
MRYATIWKVARSSPDEVIGILSLNFQQQNCPLVDSAAEIFLRGKTWPEHIADNLTAIYDQLVYKM